MGSKYPPPITIYNKSETGMQKVWKFYIQAQFWQFYLSYIIFFIRLSTNNDEDL